MLRFNKQQRQAKLSICRHVAVAFFEVFTRLSAIDNFEFLKRSRFLQSHRTLSKGAPRREFDARGGHRSPSVATARINWLHSVVLRRVLIEEDLFFA
jgi:hypothetical protein